ncbi:MAG: hypothetical protein L7F77_08385, partial [Candidatus Magnetominusculus sp. LBB02]|nr:hypothetical protein [Candidatus Magnetominusculus sp. LBB02]
DDIDALFAKKASDNTAADKQPKVMDNDDIDALFANKMADGPSYSDAQKTVVISEDLHIDASGSADEADKGVLDEQTHDYQTSFASEDVLSALPMSPEKAKIEPPRQPYQPVAVAPQNRPPEPSRPANVLLTTADVSYILRNSLEQKITRFVDEGTILSIFKESVNDYINVSFKDVSVGLNDMVSEAINTKISDVIGEINLEAIVNQVISSTIKGILATLPAEIFKMTREVTEKVITAVLQDNIPAIKRDVEKVIWEAVPGVAERLINHEIEQIKSEFM